jgi:hypothetical protein
VTFLEPDASIDVVIECATGDRAVYVLDQDAGAVRHASMFALA